MAVFEVGYNVILDPRCISGKSSKFYNFYETQFGNFHQTWWWENISMGVRQTVSNTNRTRFIQKLANIEEQIFLMKRKISNYLDFIFKLMIPNIVRQLRMWFNKCVQFSGVGLWEEGGSLNFWSARIYCYHEHQASRVWYMGKT